jgi:hypothetical protein
MKPEENLLSNIPSDDGCAAVRERLLLPPITNVVSLIFLTVLYSIGEISSIISWVLYCSLYCFNEYKWGNEVINFLLMQSREMFLFRTCNTITVGDGCVGVGELR